MAVAYQFICNSLAEDTLRLKMNVAKLVSALKGALSREFAVCWSKLLKTWNEKLFNR